MIIFNDTLQKKFGFKQGTENVICPSSLFHIYANNIDEPKRYQPEFQKCWCSHLGSEWKLLMELF